MKKILFGLTLFVSVMSFGQNRFLDTTLESVIGRNVQVIQIPDDSYDFYKTDSFKFANKLQYLALLGRKFTAIAADKYKNNSGEEKYKLALKSGGDNPEIIYYDYSPLNLSLPFKFLAQKVLVAEPIDFCDGVEIEIDKFTDEKRTRSKTIDQMSFIRNSNKGKINQYVSINIYGSTAVVNGKGLIILFKSGEKIVRLNEKVDVDVTSYGNKPYVYSVFFSPTPTEVQLLKKEVIVGAKLYIFESTVNEGEKLKQFANCVLITATIKKK
jgi:hypothetical protein